MKARTFGKRELVGWEVRYRNTCGGFDLPSSTGRLIDTFMADNADEAEKAALVDIEGDWPGSQWVWSSTTMVYK